MAAQYIPIKRVSSLDVPITAEKLDGSLFTTENQAHEFIISVRKNGVKQTVTGGVTGKFIRANGTTIFLQGSISNGDAVVRLHQDCYNVQGRFTFNIFNTQSGVTTCIYSAVGKIDMGSTETVIDAGDAVPDVSDVVAAQEAAQAAITAANTAAQTANTAAQNVGGIVARPYSSSSTYTAGDYCTNNGNLYKANQDISTAEEWTASHWTQIVMGDEVTGLKSAYQQIADVEASPNLYNPNDPDVVNNKYLNPNGTIESYSGRTVTGFIPVTPGLKVTFQKDGDWYSFNSSCFYASDKTTVVSGGVYNNYIVTVPNGADYVRVTFVTSFQNVQIECNSGTISPYQPYGSTVSLILDNTFKSNEYPASAKATKDEINREVSTAFSEIVETVSPRNLYNLNDPDVATNTYINPNGTVETVSGRTVTGYMQVTAGEKVVLSRLNGSTREEYSWASICFYNSSKSVVSGGQYNTNKLTVPVGAVYARVTFASDMKDVQIECNSAGSITAYQEYFDPYEKLSNGIVFPEMNTANSKPDSFRWHGNLSTGDREKLPVTNVKNQQVFTFSGNINTFSKLYIGRIFSNGTKYGAFEINSTNVIFYCDNGNSQTIPHGLTIANNIQIELATTNTTNLAKAVLASNGIQFDILDHMTEKRFIGDEGAPYVESDGSTLTDCSFAWTSRNINAPIWMFGDSYMSLYDMRWVYYLVQSGYDKSCIINARAGEGSAEALVSLQNLLESKNRPKYLVWALGMNDGDANNAVNATWKSCYDEVIELCNSNYIIPILATIPNTPTILNTYKNAVVTASGYRYIDFASAVGASEAESGWYSGMLNSDNVHPNIPGAIALYYQALADFPELTSD